MVVLSTLGLVVLVVIVAVGAYWLVKNVNFKQTETETEKEDSK
jgi:lipopolysaccharide export system protein LptC